MLWIKCVTIILILVVCQDIMLADVSQLNNSSFELDGTINDITLENPNGWNVNLSSDRFEGYVRFDWPIDGFYNLTLYSNSWMIFQSGDIVTVSQPVNVTDVNEIIFNLKLNTDSSLDWDPDIATALVMLDSDIVWSSDADVSDVTGEYLDQAIAIDDKYRDGQTYNFSVGLQINVDGWLYYRYITNWDFITSTLFCNGGGLLAGDFNQDCNVDVNDLVLLADSWLAEVPGYSRYNLSEPNIVAEPIGEDPNYCNGGGLLAGDIDKNCIIDAGDVLLMAQAWLDEVSADSIYNLSKLDDVDSMGIVNFRDYSILTGSWFSSSKLPGPVVNFPDYAVLTDNWLQTSWIEPSPEPNDPNK